MTLATFLVSIASISDLLYDVTFYANDTAAARSHCLPVRAGRDEFININLLSLVLHEMIFINLHNLQLGNDT